MLLLAFLLALRFALDPWDTVYYPLPFIFALLGWETLACRRPPLLALLASVVVWLVYIVAPEHLSADAQSRALPARRRAHAGRTRPGRVRPAGERPPRGRDRPPAALKRPNGDADILSVTARHRDPRSPSENPSRTSGGGGSSRMLRPPSRQWPRHCTLTASLPRSGHRAPRSTRAGQPHTRNSRMNSKSVGGAVSRREVALWSALALGASSRCCGAGGGTSP